MDKEIRKMANGLKPQFNIGKNDISDTFVDSVDKYLDAHQIVKIKVLSAVDKTQIKAQAKELAEVTNSEIVEVKGFTFTLFKE